MTSATFDNEQAYYLLRTIRRTEEKIVEIYDTDKIKSPVHLSIGQEPIAVGVCMALRHNDIVFSNYRGHAHYLAKGGDLNSMWAELFGKSNGHAAGKAGSMHLVDHDRHFMPASAIVASAISNAVGFALALKMKNDPRIVVCFHGEGAADEGVFWESLNFAALKQLPVLFVCENNDYAIYSRQKRRMKLTNIPDKAKSFGVDTYKMSGDKTENIHAETVKITEKIRTNNAPYLLEFDTYRWRDHVGPQDDHEKGYRHTDKLKQSQQADDLKAIKTLLPPNIAQAIEKRVERELDEALAYAEAGDFPDSNTMMQHVYAE